MEKKKKSPLIFEVLLGKLNEEKNVWWRKEKVLSESSLRRGIGLKRSSSEKVLAVEPSGG